MYQGRRTGFIARGNQLDTEGFEDINNYWGNEDDVNQLLVSNDDDFAPPQRTIEFSDDESGFDNSTMSIEGETLVSSPYIISSPLTKNSMVKNKPKSKPAQVDILRLQREKRNKTNNNYNNNNNNFDDSFNFVHEEEMDISPIKRKNFNDDSEFDLSDDSSSDDYERRARKRKRMKNKKKSRKYKKKDNRVKRKYEKKEYFTRTSTPESNLHYHKPNYKLDDENESDSDDLLLNNKNKIKNRRKKKNIDDSSDDDFIPSDDSDTSDYDEDYESSDSSDYDTDSSRRKPKKKRRRQKWERDLVEESPLNKTFVDEYSQKEHEDSVIYYRDEYGNRIKKRQLPKRHHVPPLAYWKNERLQYHRSDHGIGKLLPTPTQIIRAPPTPSKPVKKRNQNTNNRRNRNTGNDIPAQRPQDRDYKAGSQAIVYDSKGEDSNEVQVVVKKQAMNEISLQTTEEGLEPIIAAQAFAQESYTGPNNPGWISGYLRLPVKGCKPPERVGACSQLFFVVDGQKEGLEVSYGLPETTNFEKSAQRFLLSPGDQFFLPPFNSYRLENIGKSEAVVYWCIILPPVKKEDREKNITT